MSDVSTLSPAFVVEDAAALSGTDLSRCILLVTAGSHQFSYVVLDPLNNLFICLKSYQYGSSPGKEMFPEMLARCIGGDELLHAAFGEIRLGLDEPVHTLVPRAYFQPGRRRDYLSFLFGERPELAVRHDLLTATDAVNVYGIDNRLLEQLKETFPGAKVIHTETAWLSSLLKEHGAETGKQLYLRILPQRLTLTLLEKDKLLYHQTFFFQHELDVVYHTLQVCREYGLDPAAAAVRIGGEVAADAKVCRELAACLPRMGWLDRPSGFHYGEPFSRYPAHHFYSQLALAVCG
ncbi:DUF3822 family protein [Compostibacter hankyongensis]|uniref:DUF3822 family protein n=1 Tax=Compostibacter hankyongensis TaxID=1007089 RepID=A0ABP8G7F3_9BACT